MSISAERGLEILNAACREARTSNGERVGFRIEPPIEVTGAYVATLTLFDAADEVLDVRMWELPALPVPEDTTEARLEAFAEGMHRSGNPFDWDDAWPDAFPPWPLLGAPALVTADDFAHTMSSKEATRSVLAAQYVEAIRVRERLAPVPLEDARRLYALSWGLDAEASLEGLRGSDAAIVPYLLAVFEEWADAIEAEGLESWVGDDHSPTRSQLATSAQTWLVERANDAERERFQRLRDRGLIRRPPLDVGVLFDAARIGDVALEQRMVGSIDLASGHVVVCDPFFSSGSMSIETGVAPGRYEVTLVLARPSGWGTRVAAARLALRPGKVNRWQRVEHSFFVDAGLATFMSSETAGVFRAALEAFGAAHPAGNYYDDVLAASLAPSGTPERSDGDWGVHVVDAEHTMVVFASGKGDGQYEVLAGRDEEGRLLALAVDFGVLEGP